jgi:cytochrome c biogenesis protein CcmG/thiol:disulfide interchange protein DsbE
VRPVAVLLAIGAIGVVVVVLALVVGQTLGQPDPSLVVVSRNPLIGQPAPDISLATTDGRPVTLSELRGRPVIVNFWASWCVPCREEFPLYRDAYERHAADGLEILGVIHDDETAPAAAFGESFGAAWPLLVDPDNEAWRDYQGAFLPLSYFIDRDGVVHSVSYGPPPADVLERQIAEIL